MRPAAWELRRGHPALCPGTGAGCLYDACYRHTVCQVCGCQCGSEAAPSIPGGGRVGHHYPTDDDGGRWALAREVPGHVRPIPARPAPGQLDLFPTPEETPA